MNGFKNTTRTQTFRTSSDVGRTAGQTVGRVQSFARGGTVRRFATGGTVGGLSDPETATPGGNAFIRRSGEQPTQELEEGGGRSPLMSGYAKGGKAKHFHVHKHYHEGGKITTKSKSYMKSAKGAERAAEKQVEGAGPMMSKGGKTKGRMKSRHADGGHIIGPTHLPDGYGDYATGGTINPMATGGTINPMSAGGAAYGGMAMGGAPGALGQPNGALAARRAALAGRPMPGAIGARPLMRARGGRAGPR